MGFCFSKLTGVERGLNWNNEGRKFVEGVCPKLAEGFERPRGISSNRYTLKTHIIFRLNKII